MFFTDSITAAVWVSAIGVIGLLVRQFVPWLRQTSSAEGKLRDTLMTRVNMLEFKLERQERRYYAEMRLGIHKLRNITACFDAMLMMLKLHPDSVSEIVAEIEALRARQMIAEAKEAAALRNSEILADDELVHELEEIEHGAVKGAGHDVSE